MAGVGLLFGPMLVGVLLNMILYGAVVTQMYAYYRRFADDPAWIRYFMLYLFIVGFGNVVVECGIIFEPLIIRYGTVAAVTISPKLLHGDSIIISIVSTPIQLFAAWRISVLTRSFIFPGLVTLISLLSFASGINMSVKVFRNPEYREFPSFITAATVWLASSAVCDVVIAVRMSLALYTRKTGVTGSFVDGHVNRIIRLTLETGSLTAITALMDIFLFLGFPGTTMNFVVNFPLSSLYMCSILAMLNFRDRRKAIDVEEGHTMPTDIRFQSHSSNQSRVTDLSVDVELRGKTINI
ncbi:hypothetical protein MVEN_01966400 [Mycena venus]|uniref:DUF6534 domain-containing protein n=1 Tax=Mycena venus TaxID=2733690 RepID=A0A8H6XH78_9AGAR|nr:hypothetical protein MVEN_01966400 [Mycena venus]